jgi:phytoene dehydrogenase-like protein
VRVILRVLQDKYRQAGGERRMKCGVKKIIFREQSVDRLVLDTGEEITANHVLSSIGAAETFALCSLGEPIGPEESSKQPMLQHALGRHSFVETITVLDRQPATLGWGDDTIVFFNDSRVFEYACPDAQVDVRSGVICIPNNFDYGEGRNLGEGFFRVTCLANPSQWFGLPDATYAAGKARWFEAVQRSARRFLPAVTDQALTGAIVATDMFTPRTITKFTGHFNGAIYGAPDKLRDGRTPLQNLYICGTDQGFLGIVGAMLSGISMANYHMLTK